MLFFNYIDSTNLSFLKTSETHTSILHYFYLGSNYETLGRYSEEDAQYAFEYSLISSEERNAYYIELITNRFSSMSSSEIAELYLSKILHTWCDGFFFADNKLQRLPVNNNEINSFFLYGYGYTILRNFTQMILLGIYCLIGFNVLSNNRNDSLYVFKLAIVGIFIYLFMFEARSRYLYSFVPILFILSTEGVNVLIQMKGVNKHERYYFSRWKWNTFVPNHNSYKQAVITNL